MAIKEKKITVTEEREISVVQMECDHCGRTAVLPSIHGKVQADDVTGWWTVYEEPWREGKQPIAHFCSDCVKRMLVK